LDAGHIPVSIALTARFQTTSSTRGLALRADRRRFLQGGIHQPGRTGPTREDDRDGPLPGGMAGDDHAV